MPTRGSDSPDDARSATGAAAERYGSFVVRWRRAAEERIELEHIQSGERTRVDSAARALDWMRQRIGRLLLGIALLVPLLSAAALPAAAQTSPSYRLVDVLYVQTGGDAS